MKYHLLVTTTAGLNPKRLYFAVNEQLDTSILPQCRELGVFTYVGTYEERDLIARLIDDVGSRRLMCKLTVIDGKETFLTCLGDGLQSNKTCG